jgi:hypothetical protein
MYIFSKMLPKCVNVTFEALFCLYSDLIVYRKMIFHTTVSFQRALHLR